MNRVPRMIGRTLSLAPGLVVCLLAAAWLYLPATCDAAETMVVTAEGLADPDADAYKRDKGLMVEDLRRDAQAQCIEKAVGSLVESSTLMENYELIHDRVLTRSRGMIKRVIKESPPWIGEDGFAHMLMKAEVFVTDLKRALKEMSREEKVHLIKQYGNPKISVAILIADADRGTGNRPEQSEIAENILKERLKRFGYRVWSEDYSVRLKQEMMVKSSMNNQVEATISSQQMKAADFFIEGKAKFKRISQTLQPANIEVTKYVLTSWSVKCVDAHTGEEILYNNKVPRGKGWPSEDQAIEDIGKLIGDEFSKDFFAEHLQAPSQIIQLQVLGLPSYDVAQKLKSEFIGLRPVLNVDMRDFDKSGVSLFEVEFTGATSNFNRLLNSVIIAPLNKKIGENAFSLESAHQNTVRITFNSELSAEDIMNRLQQMPPSSLAIAAPGRIKDVVKTEAALKKVAAVAPEAARQLENEGILDSQSGLDAVKNF